MSRLPNSNQPENSPDEFVDHASEFLTQETPSEPDSQNTDTPHEIPKAIGHYEIDAVLGSGGMGQVFKGYDSKLNRFAALKILHGETPQRSLRFAQEARLQAKIDHPNVCKVYEVGDVNGRPFIAMQFIPGKTLRNASRELSFEQKLKIIKQVAEALHSAHREGLIHRDIKPANIMVVKNEDGIWHPFVLDFGLAREQEAAGMTMSGYIAGTPHYMSPEQVREASGQLDRRSDVYSLGATLYELLSGRTPYPGHSSAEVLIKVLQEDPPSLRKIDPRIPIDVETIVTKCMQKEPQQRYQSAKEVAEDLQRYLDGDPIKARPVPFTERILKKGKKNKVAAGILAAALLITLALLGTLIWVQTKARVQANYSREFNEEIRSIEAMMMSVYLAPIHDIRKDLALARERLAKIEKRITEAGSWAYGPGHNALGLGYFALDDYDKALQNLEIAWNSGYREPSTAYALGRVYGSLYQRELREADAIRNKVLREDQLKKIEKEYRDPAITYIKMSKENLDSTAYAEGLIAFYQKRYDVALKNAIEAFKQARWSYDAKKLEGDLYVSAGEENDRKGEYEQFTKNFALAGNAYRTAIELGRSRAEIYLREADRLTSVLSRNAERGVSTDEAFQQALKYADQAIAINADLPESYSRKMKVYTSLGDYLMYNTGDDPRSMMEKAIKMGDEVHKRSPNDYSTYQQLGTAYRLVGEYEIRHGIDALNSLTKGIQNFEKSLEIRPGNTGTLSSLGVTYTLLGEYDTKHGKDPRSSYQAAIKQYLTAQRINPDYNPPYTNAAIAYWFVGNYEVSRGLDPRRSFKEAISQIEKALKSNPNNGFAYFNVSLVYCEAGRFELMAGRDPSDYYKRSLDALNKCSKLMDNSYLPNSFGTTYYLMAEVEFEKGKDPTELLNRSAHEFKKSIKIDPANYEPYGLWGRSDTLAARWAIKNGNSPDAIFKAAEQNLRKSVQLNTKESAIYQLYATALQRHAEWLQKNNQPSMKVIDEGLKMVNSALALDSNSAEGFAIQGTLLLLKADAEKDVQARSNSMQIGEASLKKALNLNKWLNREYGPVLEKHNSKFAVKN